MADVWPDRGILVGDGSVLLKLSFPDPIFLRIKIQIMSEPRIWIRTETRIGNLKYTLVLSLIPRFSKNISKLKLSKLEEKKTGIVKYSEIRNQLNWL